MLSEFPNGGGHKKHRTFLSAFDNSPNKMLAKSGREFISKLKEIAQMLSELPEGGR